MKKFVIILSVAIITFVVSMALLNSYRESNNEVINLTAEVKSSLIKYTHPSGKFSYSYSDLWEFVPKREDMGLRPKEYGGQTKNEIVTILFFPDKGTDLRATAKGFDGGYDEDWKDINKNGINGLLYQYSSDNLSNTIYWFSSGKDAVKVMFRKYNAMAIEGQKDNSKFEADFNVILESFRFNNI